MVLGPSLRLQEDRVRLCQLLKWPDEKPNSRKVNRLFEVEAAARFECSKGRRCVENSLGDRIKGTGKWRDIENVRIVQERGAEGLEAWDEVSHFNAKKAHLLQAR